MECCVKICKVKMKAMVHDKFVWREILIYDDAMPYFCLQHTTCSEDHRMQKAMHFINDLEQPGWDLTMSLCTYTCLRKRLNNVCLVHWKLDACLASLLFSAYFLILYFHGYGCYDCDATQSKRSLVTLATNSSFDKSKRSVALGCHVPGLFCCWALSIWFNISKYSINTCLCAEY